MSLFSSGELFAKLLFLFVNSLVAQILGLGAWVWLDALGLQGAADRERAAIVLVSCVPGSRNSWAEGCC